MDRFKTSNLPIVSPHIRLFQLAALIALVFSTSVLISEQVQAADKPNIVLVMADDQGWGDMAYNGHPVVKTPNFDLAAKTGLRFDRFYAAAPVCSPTRASVLTGRTPNRMGVFKWGYPMRPQEKTLAEALKTAGYATAHFGKWHLGSVVKESPANPGNNGFDHWLSAPNFYDNNPILSRNGIATQMEGESSVIAAQAANNWMSEQSKTDNPFLAVVWFGSPHLPHRAIEADRKLYEDQPKNMQNFLGEVTGMDRAFGMIRDQLKKLDISENTILWYCSDNGALPKVGSTGGHRGFKGKVYEGGLLVPAILEWPAKIPKPRTTNYRSATLDIYPTLLEIAGVKVENQPTLDGESLLGLIEGKSNDRAKPFGFWDTKAKGISQRADVLMQQLFDAQRANKSVTVPKVSQNAAALPSTPHPLDSFPGHSAWIEKDWKLHRIEKNQKVTYELYDLANDPFEKKNVLKLQAKVTISMKNQLDEWLKSVVNSLNGADYSEKK